MKVILLSIFILFLAGCSTKYQPDGFKGGFQEIQLSENVFSVSFRGNAYTSREEVTNYALLRSAEVALLNGYNYFILNNSEKTSKEGNFTTPTNYNTTYQSNIYGNQIYGNSRTNAYGGQNISYSKPTTTNTIICFKEKPETNQIVYDAKFIVKTIKEKYDIKN